MTFLQSGNLFKKLSMIAIALLPLFCLTTVVAPASASNLVPIAQFLFPADNPGYDSVNNLSLEQHGPTPIASNCGLPAKLSFSGCVNLSGQTWFASTGLNGSWPNLPTGNSPYTISAWVKFNISDYSGVVGWGNSDTAQGNNLREDGSCNNVWNYWYARDAGGGSDVNLCDGSWHSLIATYDGSDGLNRQIYIDGHLAESYGAASGLNFAANTNFVLGKTTADVPMNGSLADVQIFNQYFSSSDVTERFSNPAGTTTVATPDAPTNLSVSTPRSGGIITLSWSPVADNGSGPITNYVCSSGAVVTISVTATSCTFTNKSLIITNNTASLSVVAVNQSGTSDPATLPVQWASPPTTTTTTTTPVITTKTITCHKGSKSKKVTGVTPACPSGWKK
jgi:hypothetical protein